MGQISDIRKCGYLNNEKIGRAGSYEYCGTGFLLSGSPGL